MSLLNFSLRCWTIVVREKLISLLLSLQSCNFAVKFKNYVERFIYAAKG